jgi:hypothetical protein
MDWTISFCAVLGLAFPLRQPLPQAAPTQRRFSSLGAQDGVSRGEIGFADAPEARLLTRHRAQKELSNGFKASEVRP